MESDELSRYLDLTTRKECRDIVTEIHPHYVEMYLCSVCQMTALHPVLSDAPLLPVRIGSVSRCSTSTELASNPISVPRRTVFLRFA